jgi:hypothetical protein
MSGADSTAARYSVGGTAQKVRVAIKPQGATKTTYYTVQSGYADVSASYYTKASQQTTAQPAQRGAWFIPINFVFTEAGYGVPLALQNDLPSSPHFIEDSDGDGTADGVYDIGTPTVVFNTNRWSTGGRSQQFTTDSSTTEGIRSDVVAAPIGTDFVIMVDISALETGNDPITIAATNGVGGQSSTKEFDPANPTGYDKTWIDQGGFSWYRYTIAHTIAVAADCRIEVKRISTNATQNTTVSVDKWYLQLDTTTIPDAWCSSSALKNRYDPASTSACATKHKYR